jgi:hypothetical protein
MTKKHFIALADVIRHDNATLGHADHAFDSGHLEVLADFCASQNPRFDRERWLGYIAGTNGPSGGAVKPSVRKQTRVHADDEGSF